MYKVRLANGKVIEIDDFGDVVDFVLRHKEFVEKVICYFGGGVYSLYEYGDWNVDNLDDFEVEILDKKGVILW